VASVALVRPEVLLDHSIARDAAFELAGQP